jgi:hypothetical protein
MEEPSVRAHQPATQEHCTINIYPNGTISDRGHLEHRHMPTPLKRPKPGRKGRRSAITRFSKASASRLRRLLAQTRGPQGWTCFGLTLTVPGPNITDGDWRRLWRAFLARARRLEGAAFIWRIEKQERGQPHIHCVCWEECRVKAFRLKELWLENLALLGPYEGPANVKLESSITCGQCHGEFKPGWAKVTSREIWPGASEHAVKIDSLAEKDDMCWWRYLAAHASKSKQAQLGWRGRQWGVFNKHLLAPAEPTVLELPREAMNKAIRCMKRVTRSRRASNHGRQTWFIHPDTVRRICEWARGEPRPVQHVRRTAFSPFAMGKKEKRERAKAKRRELLGVPA